MDFNPKWRQDSSMDKVERLLQLEPLIAFLETKKPDDTYMYCDNDYCMFGQYFAAHGIKAKVCMATIEVEGKVYDIPEDMRRLAVGREMHELRAPSTFGFALMKAKECLEATNNKST